MEISDKVLTAAGLKPSDVDSVDGIVDASSDTFTEADEEPIDLG